jgi:hypothetical protein
MYEKFGFCGQSLWMRFQQHNSQKNQGHVDMRGVLGKFSPSANGFWLVNS